MNALARAVRLLPRDGSKWVDERGDVWDCGGCYEPFEGPFMVRLHRKSVMEGHPDVNVYESMPLPLDLFRQLFKPHFEVKP